MKLSLLLFVFSLSACQAEYEDISNDTLYSSVINSRYETLEVLVVHGVTMSKRKNKKVDYYKVSRKPGGGGRYVIDKFDLTKGSEIEIKKVFLCTNCIPKRTVFLINLFSEKLIPGKPIKLVDLSVNSDDGQFVMNPKILIKK